MWTTLKITQGHRNYGYYIRSLRSLHWLRITERIKYKLISLHLPTKFSQLPNLHTFITSSLFNVFEALTLHLWLLLLGHRHYSLLKSLSAPIVMLHHACVIHSLHLFVNLILKQTRNFTVNCRSGFCDGCELRYSSIQYWWISRLSTIRQTVLAAVNCRKSTVFSLSVSHELASYYIIIEYCLLLWLTSWLCG